MVDVGIDGAHRRGAAPNGGDTGSVDVPAKPIAQAQAARAPSKVVAHGSLQLPGSRVVRCTGSDDLVVPFLAHGDLELGEGDVVGLRGSARSEGAGHRDERAAWVRRAGVRFVVPPLLPSTSSHGGAFKDAQDFKKTSARVQRRTSPLIRAALTTDVTRQRGARGSGAYLCVRCAVCTREGRGSGRVGRKHTERALGNKLPRVKPYLEYFT